jgi:alpha-ribazole phosphatase/probable phosphoglycerate mutase
LIKGWRLKNRREENPLACRIYLVRHGETAWNAQLKFQGHADIALSPKGLVQAEKLSRRLAKCEIAAVYASDLTRAYETARILARPHHLDVIPCCAFREINFGLWDGLTIEEIKKDYRELLRQWWHGPLETRVPQGETLDEVVNRVNRLVKEIVVKHATQQIIIVSHGGPIRAIVGTVLGMDLNQYWRLRLDNGCLTIIDFPASSRPGWKPGLPEACPTSLNKGIVALLNDCSHLEG